VQAATRNSPDVLIPAAFIGHGNLMNAVLVDGCAYGSCPVRMPREKVDPRSRPSTYRLTVPTSDLTAARARSLGAGASTMPNQMNGAAAQSRPRERAIRTALTDPCSRRSMGSAVGRVAQE
jgi:hypothetical protein